MAEGIMRYATLVQVDQPDKLKEIYRKSSESMSKMTAGPIKQQITIQPDAESYGDRKGDVMTIKQEITPEADPIGIQKKMNEAMFGPGGMVTRVVALKDSVVQTMGGGKEAMDALLKGIDATPGPTDARKPARDDLTKQANLVLLLDLPGVVVEGVKIAAGSGAMPLPIDAAGLDKLSIKRSFIGTSAVAEAQAVRVKTQIPLEQFKGIAELVKFVQSSMGGPPPM
jgi:hypothetical protein